jgi:hypothetical protein
MTKRVTISEAIRATVLPLKVETMLTSFKASIDAYEVATFDGWQGKFPPNTTSPAQLWEAIGQISCFETDWSLFKSRLIRHGESEVTCSCGAHLVSAFLIRQRWSLIVLGRQSLITPASELLPIRTKTMEALARILPELDKGEASQPTPGDPRGGGDGGAGPAELGIPVWWARGKN